jgi:transcriptional regulator with XRE-family HTH domain
MSTNAKRAVKNLRKMIVNSGQSSEKVAFGAGVSKSTIHHYLTGKRTPSIAVLEKIADYLKKDFIEFFK